MAPLCPQFVPSGAAVPRLCVRSSIPDGELVGMGQIRSNDFADQGIAGQVQLLRALAECHPVVKGYAQRQGLRRLPPRRPPAGPRPPHRCFRRRDHRLGVEDGAQVNGFRLVVRVALPIHNCASIQVVS